MPLSDDFNRSNSTTAVGSTSVGGVAWQALAGTWGISGNAAYVSNGLAALACFAVVETGDADCAIETTIATASSISESGLFFRVASAGNGYFVHGGNGSNAARLRKAVSGTYSTLASSASNVHFSPDDVVRVELSGSSIVVKHNGATIISTTDSTYTTQTKHGLFTLAPSGGASVASFDSFSVAPIVASASAAASGSGTTGVTAHAVAVTSAPATGSGTTTLATVAVAITAAAAASEGTGAVNAYAVGSAVPVAVNASGEGTTTIAAQPVLSTSMDASGEGSTTVVSAVVEPGDQPLASDTANDAEKLTLGGWGVAEWEPAVVPTPAAVVGQVRHAVISAIAYGPVTMNGTQPVFTYSEADAPRMRQRILLAGRDATYDRGVPVPNVEYELADLLLYGPGTLDLPQYAAMWEVGTAATERTGEGRRVKVQLVDDFTDPEHPTVQATIYKGFVMNPGVDGRHLTLELGGEAQGRLSLRDSHVLFKDVLDISRLIWRELTDVGVRYLPRLGEPGIGIKSLNFGGVGKLEKVEELLARAVKKDGTQRAVLPDDQGIYRIFDKDTETIHFSVFVDDAFTVPRLSSDIAEKPNSIYATAIAPNGMRIDGAAVPGLITTPAPAYPMNDNSSFGIGTTNEDTDSGDGVSIMVNRLGAVGLLDIRDTPGGFDEDVADALDKLARRAKVEIGPVGQMTPTLWRALWDLDVTGRSPNWSTIQPTAQDPSVQRYLRSASGAPIALNPEFDRDAIQVDESIDMGSGLRERQVDNFAETRVHPPGAKVWYGTITVNLGAVLAGRVDIGATLTPDMLVDARLAQPGRHNLWVPNFDGGTLFGISGAQVSGDSVTFTVDTRHRPAREVWERLQVRRETRNDPARRMLGNRQSTRRKDAVRGFISWGGIVDRDVPLKRGWNVIEIVAGDYGTMQWIETVVQTVTGTGGAISIEGHEYAVAVFGKPITAKRLNELIPNPLTISGTKMWQTKRAQLDKYWLLYSAGTHDEPCGYSPGRKKWKSETGEEPNPDYNPDADENETGTDDDETITVTTSESFGTVTGQHVDDGTFPYATANGATVFLAVRVSKPTTLRKGRVLWPVLEGGV